ncbi:hypothetical protein QR685DRAFT_587110, partial [Neurospora intermedia]
VHQKHEPTNEYALYHAVLLSTAEYLKRLFVVSEFEIHLEDNVAAIPRTLPSKAETLSYEQQHEAVLTKHGSLKLSIDHHAAQKDQLEHIQDQDWEQEQDHLTLLASLNKQTTSLLQTYSQSQANRKDEGDTDVLEQALVLGRIALVLASLLIAVSTAPGNSIVECRLAAHSKARAEVKVQEQTQVQREAAVALANMGVALVEQFDRTRDRRDLEEARRGGGGGGGGGVYARERGCGREREVRVERGEIEGVGKGNWKWEVSG